MLQQTKFSIPVSPTQHHFSIPEVDQKSVLRINRGPDAAVVGEGHQGRVYLVHYDVITNWAALKIFNEQFTHEDILHETHMNLLLNESGLIPKFYGAVVYDKNIALLSEFIGNDCGTQDITRITL